MNKTDLVKSAQSIYTNNEDCYKAYAEHELVLINEMNKAMLQRADIKELVGEDNLQMMQDNHANHVRFIASVLKDFNAEVLVETILWVFRAYRSRGFASNYWAAQLNTWMQILKNELPEDAYKKVYPIYDWMQINIPSFVICSDEKLEGNLSLH
jgi:hypothetical protein